MCIADVLLLAGGSTIKHITEQSGAHINVGDTADGNKLAEINGSGQASIQAAVGVLGKLHNVEGDVQVQLSVPPQEDQTATKVSQCRHLAEHSPLSDGAVVATLTQADEVPTGGHYYIMLLKGEVKAVLAVLHRMAELIWDVQDAFGIAIMCAEIPAGRVGGLIGQGGANAKHLRGLGVDFDVPRSRPQIGNCTIQFIMPSSARAGACSAVQGFVGADVGITWSAASLPVAAGGQSGAAAAGSGGDMDAVSATEALQDACRSAVAALLVQMQSPERPTPAQIGDVLQKHKDGITVDALGRLQRGVFACYQAAFGVGLGHAAHGEASTAAVAALQWMTESLKLVHGESIAAMQSPLVASTLQSSQIAQQLNKNTECLFFPSPSAHSRLLQLLRRASVSLDVAVFSITDNDIADTLVAAMQRGVAVRVISDDEQVKQQGSDILRLQAAGMPVKVDASPAFHMHHKFAIIDGLTVATGSYNWTQQAHTGNQENLLVVEDAGAVREYQGCFQGMWDSFQAPHA